MRPAPTDAPVILEAAINGANPIAPRLPDEITATALACFDGGAAVVHNHIDLFGSADEAAARYREGWEPVLAQRPDALLYPTINGIGPVEERYSHIAPLAETGGLRIGVIDPGSVNLGASFAYVNSGADIEHQRQAVRAAWSRARDVDLRARVPPRRAVVLAGRKVAAGHHVALLLRWP